MSNRFVVILLFALVVAWSVVSGVQAGENAEVSALLQEVQQDLPKIPADKRLEVRISYVEVLIRNGRVKEAAAECLECLKLANEVPEKLKRDVLLDVIAERQAEMGEFKAAIQTYWLITDDNRQFFCWIKICDSAGLEKNFPVAMEYAESDRKAPDPEILRTSLFDILIQRKNFDRALHLTSKFRDESTRKSHTTYIGIRAAAVGDLATALRIAERFPDSSINGANLWLAIGEAQAAVGKVVESRAAFERARKLLAPVLQTNSCEVAVALVRLGDTDAALRTLRQIPSDELYAGYLEVVKALTVAGKGELALELSREITEVSCRVSALRNIALEEQIRGNPAAARRALQGVTEVPGYLSTGILRDVIPLQHRLGDRAKAAIRLQEIIAAIDPVKEKNGKAAYELMQIAEVQAEIGLAAKSAATFQRALDSALKNADVDVRILIISEYVLRRRAFHLGSADISKWAAAQADPRTRAVFRLGIARGLLDRGK